MCLNVWSFGQRSGAKATNQHSLVEKVCPLGNKDLI